MKRLQSGDQQNHMCAFERLHLPPIRVPAHILAHMFTPVGGCDHPAKQESRAWVE